MQHTTWPLRTAGWRKSGALIIASSLRAVVGGRAAPVARQNRKWNAIIAGGGAAGWSLVTGRTSRARPDNKPLPGNRS
ncbi:unnamed protein product, partial [Iphiclides podalirius]